MSNEISSIAHNMACDDAILGRLRLHDLPYTVTRQAVMAGENSRGTCSDTGSIGPQQEMPIS